MRFGRRGADGGGRVDKWRADVSGTAGDDERGCDVNAETLFDLGPDRAPMAVHEMPAARLESAGTTALADSELLAVVLGGEQGRALEIARRMVAEAGSVQTLAKWTVREFETAGLAQSTARRMAAVVELGRRALLQPVETEPLLSRPDAIAGFMQPYVAGLEVEKFWVLCLNRKNRLIRCVCISTGTATAALAHPREVFKAAVRESAAAVVCVHNHPSGDPAPSTPDLQVTRQLREAARTLDIQLVDHVICGRGNADPAGRGFFSFREAGLL